MIVLLVVISVALGTLVGALVWIGGPAAVWSAVGVGGLARVFRR